MRGIENRIDLCFNLLNTYESRIREAILKNNITQEDTENIMKNFYFKNEMLFSLNKEYKKGRLLKDFCNDNKLSDRLPEMLNFHHSLYKHQENSINAIMEEKCTIISTGTGSGKTESFLIPILDYCIKNRGKKGVKALIIYPMNALAGDQLRRIEESVKNSDISYALFNGETPSKKDLQTSNNNNIYREDIVENKPDILITNYVMLERILTNEDYMKIFKADTDVFKYIVLDEIHTYNGNKALHIKFLLDRLKYFLNTDVVQIGCSATLSRKKDGIKTDGYISGDINEFITKMFSIKDSKRYEYIEPIYEVNRDNKCDIDDKDYKNLMDDSKTKLIKELLNSECRSFSEIIEALNNECINVSEVELKKYFSDVLRMNEKYNSKPILDFRIHLFMLDIGECLRRCVNCGKHYTLYMDRCNECGYVLLPVYKENPRLLLGNLKNGEISDPEKIMIGEKTKLVLLDFDGLEEYKYKHTLRFDTYESKSNSIKLRIDKEGKYKVYCDESIYHGVIVLKNNSNDVFLYELLKLNFMQLNDKDKKILAFIDNREKAGRYSTVFGDKLLSDLYFEIIKYCNGSEKLSINELRECTIKLLKEYLTVTDKVSEAVKDIIIHDFDIWFRRAIINRNFRESHKNFKFELDIWAELNEVDNFILNLAYSEGAFFEERLREYGNIIRVSRSSFEFDKGIAFRSFEGKNVISLSPHASKYKVLIELYGQDKIKNSIEKLVSLKVLKEVSHESSYEVKSDIHYPASIFYLDKDNILVNTENSDYNTLDEIFQEHLLLAGAHTSEVEKMTKKAHEDDFQEGSLNLLVSTPTLEMGIDIGSLSFVYMLGVPPVPSNYAQRAGRAGRRGDRFAGIITICSENSNHDWYHFYNPKEIVEGLITPPKFDVENIKVLNKHINTFVYPRLANKSLICLSSDEKLYLEKTCTEIFRKNIDINKHIELLRNRLKDSSIKSREKLYKEGIYPEYCFNRHEIKLLRKDKNDKDKEFVIGTREPELAYKQIVPGNLMFIGEKYYSMVEYRDAKSFTSMNNKVIVSNWKYQCEDRESRIKLNKVSAPKKSYVLVNLDKKENVKKSKGPVKIYHSDDMRIELISEVYSESGISTIGYKLNRDTIVFEFDKSVISNEQYISLISLLDKTIKFELGLDDNELALIMGDEVLINNITSEEHIEENKDYVLIYDRTGNENVDMMEVLDKICKSIDSSSKETLLRKAYDKVLNCQCEKQSGCYLCIKSFNTQAYSYSINKNSAKNFVGYLIGKEKLRPSVSITEEILKYELELNIRQKGTEFILSSNGKERVLINKIKQNETIINGILEEIKTIYEEDDIETICITTPLDYLVRGINEVENINVSDNYLNLFMFYKQAFKSIIAKKEVK